MSKKTNTYSSLIYSKSVSSVNDVVENKLLDIHNQLYELAKEKYIIEYITKAGITYENFMQNNIIVENRKFNYTEPSTMVIRNLETFKTETVDLTNYWPKYEFISKPDSIIYTNPDLQSKGYNKLEYIDYARNLAIFKNSFTNTTYETSLKNISEKTNISDTLSTKNTFSEILKRKRKKINKINHGTTSKTQNK